MSSDETVIARLLVVYFDVIRREYGGLEKPESSRDLWELGNRAAAMSWGLVCRPTLVKKVEKKLRSDMIHLP